MVTKNVYNFFKLLITVVLEIEYFLRDKSRNGNKERMWGLKSDRNSRNLELFDRRFRNSKFLMKFEKEK